MNNSRVWRRNVAKSVTCYFDLDWDGYRRLAGFDPQAIAMALELADVLQGEDDERRCDDDHGYCDESAWLREAVLLDLLGVS